MTWLGRFGPHMPLPPLREVVMAAAGAAVGLFVADVILWLMTGAGPPLLTQTALIAPFGASAFLIFAVPNSPLAQPWPAVIGNTVSALSAMMIVQTPLPLVPAISAAVLLAMVAMALSRATHPPGGAVAVATVLLANSGHGPGWTYALLPVFAGTAALVGVGMVWNRATGHPYPTPLQPR